MPGLPVGPLPSAVVANAVLAVVDREIASAGWRHVRWVDDVWASARDRRHAERALHGLRLALAAEGLELNEAKTEILDAADASARLEIEDVSMRAI